MTSELSRGRQHDRKHRATKIEWEYPRRALSSYLASANGSSDIAVLVRSFGLSLRATNRWAPLARVEARNVLSVLLARTRDITLDPHRQPRWVNSLMVGRNEVLPRQLDPLSRDSLTASFATSRIEGMKWACAEGRHRRDSSTCPGRDDFAVEHHPGHPPPLHQ